MSALGQKATCARQNVMSALPSKADMCGARGHFCFGPNRHDRPHSSTLATKQEKRIRQRPPIVIVPLIVAAARGIVPSARGKKEAGVPRKVAIVGRLARYKPALRLVAQHRDKFGAIVGLGAQRLV